MVFGSDLGYLVIIRLQEHVLLTELTLVQVISLLKHYSKDNTGGDDLVVVALVLETVVDDIA